MEDPVQEISNIIHTLTQALPSQQKAAIEQYFTPTASFTHPFCATSSWSTNIAVPYFGSLNSRLAILGIYRWYKILSPHISLTVESVTFNEGTSKLYVDIHQHFRLWIVPFYDADVRLTTILQLAEGDDSGPDSASASNHIARLGRRSKPELTHSEKPFSYAPVADPNRPDNGAEKLGLDVNSSSSSNDDTTRYYITSQNDLYQTSEWIKFLLPFGIGHALVLAWMFFATFQSLLGAMLLWPITLLLERGKAEDKGT